MVSYTDCKLVSKEVWTDTAKWWSVYLRKSSKEHNIPTALTDQTPNCAPRRRRKTLPIHKPITFQKQVLVEKVEAGEILVG